MFRNPTRILAPALTMLLVLSATLPITSPIVKARPQLQNPTPTLTLVPPVATPTSQLPPPASTPTPALPPPAATPTLPAPAATATPNQPSTTAQACNYLRSRVPDAVINAALANPGRIGGFDRPRNPNKPSSPLNPPRRYLSLSNPNVPYHPIFNRLTWVAGCPWSKGYGARPPR
jgi:hypothetical protein